MKLFGWFIYDDEKERATPKFRTNTLRNCLTGVLVAAVSLYFVYLGFSLILNWAISKNIIHWTSR